jgi:hypothetical protein
MIWDAIDAVVRVEVFVHRDLKYGRTALTIEMVSKSVEPKSNRHLPRDDGGIGEKKDPHSVPAIVTTSMTVMVKGESKVTNRSPYFSMTLSLFATQFLYHL